MLSQVDMMSCALCGDSISKHTARRSPRGKLICTLCDDYIRDDDWWSDKEIADASATGGAGGGTVVGV